MPWTKRSPAMPAASRSSWPPTALSPSPTTAAAFRRPASEIQGQVGAGSDHVHAACGREIRLGSLRDIRRPARRRRVGCQRAVRTHGGRSRARGRSFTAWRSSAANRKANSRSGKARNRRGTKVPSGPTRRFSAPIRALSPSGCSRWRARRRICSAGVEIRWSCDPGADLRDNENGRKRRRCISPMASGLSL